MTNNSSPDFVLCFYCPNEATRVIEVHRDSEVVRRWVCSYHVERRPKRRRRKMRVPSLI
jgi:hypothetical protein